MKEVGIDDFLGWVTRARPDALLELPIEQITAQIQTAAELALAADTAHPLVLAIVGSSPEEGNPQSMASTGVAEKVSETEAEMRERTRVSYVVQRRLDALLIDVKQRWRQILRLLSLVVSIVVTSVLAAVFGLWDRNVAGIALLVLMLSALGSFFASVARDLIAFVERIRS